jgi:hypothetical protein
MGGPLGTLRTSGMALLHASGMDQSPFEGEVRRRRGNDGNTVTLDVLHNVSRRGNMRQTPVAVLAAGDDERMVADSAITETSSPKTAKPFTSTTDHRSMTTHHHRTTMQRLHVFCSVAYRPLSTRSEAQIKIPLRPRRCENSCFTACRSTIALPDLRSFRIPHATSTSRCGT